MSSFDNHLNDSASVTPSEIDRLVDGELAESEQRSLLERLEDTPDGWRQLALAYVEASVWRNHFSAIEIASDNTTSLTCVAQSSARTSVDDGRSISVRTIRSSRTGTNRTFFAVMVMIVFGLGVWFGKSRSDSQGQPMPIADNSVPHETGTTGPQSLRSESPTSATDSASPPIPESVQVVYSDGQSDVLRVLDVPLSAAIPLRSTDQLNQLWSHRESAIPAELRSELEKAGHQIHESRDFWPAQLPDGRPVVIPVSQIHVASNSLVYP